MMISSMLDHARRVYRENHRDFSEETMIDTLNQDIHDLSALPDDFYYKKAPVAILITSNPDIPGIHKDFYKADVAIAITHGIIMAAALGLSSCRMGLSEMIFNKDKKIKSKYNIPENERVDGIVAFGYSSLEWKQIPPRGPVKVIWNQ